MANNKVNIFSKPEEVDAIMKSRLAQFSSKGGCQKNSLVKWTDAELELRDAVIMDYLTINGLSRERTAQEIAARWDVTLQSARNYIKDAITRFSKNYVEIDEATRRKIFEEKINAIFEDAVDAKDRSNSLKAMDMLNKMNGLYRDKSDVNLNVEGSISFDFGTE